MPIVNLFGMLFEWHDDKFALVNIKRGYTLEEIASVFDDDYAVTVFDPRHYDDNEQRLLTTGTSSQFRLVTVAWVERDEVARVVTAFKPSVDQKKRYNYAKRQ